MQDEIFDVVDDNDNVVGTATRKEVHARGLIHRSVLFFLLDRKGRVFVSQRTATKEFFPEYWSIVFGGHLHSGETYEQAVARESEEELGLKLKPIFVADYRLRWLEGRLTDNENSKVYALVTDEEPTLDAGELKQGSFMTLEEAKKKIKAERFLPETRDMLKIIERFLG
ncbi:MAG: NUDIX domain-containing protein [Candidatus Aenigmarchaeota archaeon]|nr:NUDIX domain-containing protein [Candidatus Aenigmarchaeota archaeon]